MKNTPEELDKIARCTGASTVVITEELTVWSPYDLSFTKTLMEIIEEELGATRALLDVKIEDPILIWIEAVESSGGDNFINLSDSLTPAKAGVSGCAGEEGRFILLYGPPQTQWGFVMYNPHFLRGSTRHEMAHIVFFQAGFRGDRWLQEGFAEYVRSMHMMKDGGLVQIALPIVIFNRTRGLPDRYSLSKILDWTEPLNSLEGTQAHYNISHSLMHFLIQKQDDRPLQETLKRIEGLSRKEILAFEAEWRAWLIGLDFGSLVREYAASPNPVLREDAANWMVQLAEDGCEDVQCDEMDLFAIRLLEDPLTARAAADFILSHRHEAIRKEFAGAMLDPQRPFTFLVGQALRALRGGAIDQAACEEAYRRLTEEERENLFDFKKNLFPDGVPSESGPPMEISQDSRQYLLGTSIAVR